MVKGRLDSARRAIAVLLQRIEQREREIADTLKRCPHVWVKADGEILKYVCSSCGKEM
jgi:hypothetical protein